MITLVHGGQTGVDRGAHEAALDNGWRVEGTMPRDGRDEYGPIPPDVARYLRPCEVSGLAARTEINARMSDVILIVVCDADDPRITPGTAKTIDLAAYLHKRRRIVDPGEDAALIARWLWNTLIAIQLPLPLEALTLAPWRQKLMVAGPRERKWAAGRVETAGLLRRVGLELREAARIAGGADAADDGRG
jgi:hypothetical protein